MNTVSQAVVLELVGNALGAEIEGQLEDMFRRDWATRVLDAWAEADDLIAPPCPHKLGQSPWTVEVPDENAELGTRAYEGETPDAARLAAAEAVFESLPESVRAELGPKP